MANPMHPNDDPQQGTIPNMDDMDQQDQATGSQGGFNQAPAGNQTGTQQQMTGNQGNLNQQASGNQGGMQQQTAGNQDTLQQRGFPSEDLQADGMQQQATMGQNSPQDARATPSDQDDAARGGMPGDGAGRRDETGTSGVYPLSASQGASGNAPIIGEEAWGQGDRGAAGYSDSGDSETMTIPSDGADNQGDQAEG